MKKIIYFIIIIFLISIFTFSVIKIIKWNNENKQTNEILDTISNAIEVDQSEENEEDKYSINFQELSNINSNLVGWLKVNGTNIEYPVVQSTDNSYYLTHNFEKTYNSAGWIFADYRNLFNGTDKNIIIYGHNRKDNSMFGTLKNVLTEEWYKNEENRKILFFTENENSIYEVFSVYTIEKEDYYIQTEFTNEDYKEFLETIKKRSIYDFNIEITEDDTILTLSTCDNNNKYRVVLHAKKI